jgi:hypothetical protein
VTVQSTTSRGFKLIDFNSDNWHDDEWDNWTLLDALLAAANPTATLPVVGGTTHAITLDYTPNKVLANGLNITFMLAGTPTGAVTVNVDGTGVRDLKVQNSAVAVGDFVAGDIVTAIYDGVAFQTLSPIRRTSGAIAATVGASGATAHADADGIVLQDAVHTGISILTPNTQKGTVAFGDPEDNDVGRFEYNHATNTLTVYVNGAATLEISSAGLRTVIGSMLLNMSGANDLMIEDDGSDVVRIGSSGAATGLFVNLTTGVTTMSKLGVSTVSGNLTRETKGIHAYFNDPLMTGGRLFIQATGADPTSLPGDIVFEW